MPKKAIIIGAGPAGVAAAYELLKRINISVPINTAKLGEIGRIFSITAKEKHPAATTTQSVNLSAMNENSPLQNKTSPSSGFINYLFDHKTNRKILIIAGLSLIVQFIVFKLLYPYPGFINGDSYVYLQSANLNSTISTYPIGYSKFLRLFSVFSRSDTALVAFQYFSIEVSALLFAFTLFYYFPVRHLIKWITLSLILYNPVFLYVSNYVSSDSLFVALSLLWLTSLLWLIQRPTPQIILVQVLLLFLCFIIRYNALYYPLVSTIAIILSPQSIRRKIMGIAGSFLIIVVFVLYTAEQFKELTGARQFSPFSGWQIANNALYAYRYVDSNELKKVPSVLAPLDKMVRHYFDTSRNLSTHPEETLLASTTYMWDYRSPLQKYMKQQFINDSAATPLKRWAIMAPLYNKYGTFIISHYPLNFVKYYLLPNFIQYCVPPGEFLYVYNMGRDTVSKSAVLWFGYKSNKVKTAFKTLQVNILGFMPIYAAVINVLFLASSIFSWSLKSLESSFSKFVILSSVLWIFNFWFSVFASPIALRYQLFSIVVYSSFSILVIEQIYNVAFQNPPATKQKTHIRLIKDVNRPINSIDG
jgi:hypothetical protein